MKTKRIKLVRILGFLTLAVLTSGMLISCKSNKEKDSNTLKVSDVTYNKLGKYETTIEAKNLDPISKESLNISYMGLKNVNNEMCYDLKNAHIDYVTKEKNEAKVGFSLNELGISDVLTLELRNGIKEDFKLIMNDVSLTSDLKEVNKNLESFDLNLELKGASFIDGVKETKITLEGVFKGLQVTKIENTKNKMSLKIMGKLDLSDKLNKSGIIKISSDATVEGIKDLSLALPLKSEILSIDNKSLKMDGEKVMVDLVTSNVFDGTKLTESDISISNSKVTLNKLSNKTLDRVTLELVMKADNLNQVREVLNNTHLKIKDKEIEMKFTDAGFKAIFDFLEKVDDKFILDIKLLPLNGRFKDLKKEDISLGLDFKDAKILNLVHKKDEYSVLRLELDSLNQTEDDFSREGLIQIKKEAFNTLFNTTNLEDSVSQRVYDQDSMGKFGINEGDLYVKVSQLFKGKINGNITEKVAVISFKGKIIAGIAGAIQGFEAAYDLLTLILTSSGIIESSEMANQKLLQQMTDEMLTEIHMQQHFASEINASIINDTLDNFNLTLANLLSYTLRYQDLIKETSLKNNITIPDINASKADKDLYIKALKATKVNEEVSYQKIMRALLKYYTEIVGMVNAPYGDSIFNTYQELLELSSNFNTQTFLPKMEFATLIGNVLGNSYGVIEMDNLLKEIPSSLEAEREVFLTWHNKVSQVYDDNLKEIEKYTNPLADLKIYSYTFNTYLHSKLGNRCMILPSPLVLERVMGGMPQYVGNLDYVSSEKVQKFINKMNGRTLEEELYSAAFYPHTPITGEDGKVLRYEDGENKGMFKFKDDVEFMMPFLEGSKPFGTGYARYMKGKAKSLEETTYYSYDNGWKFVDVRTFIIY